MFGHTIPKKVKSWDSLTPDKKAAEKILQRYLTNVRLIKTISAEFKIKSFFVWQPVPDYGMDISTHPFFYMEDLQTSATRQYGYSEARKEFDKHLPEIIWCADLAKTWNKNYVDKVHYSGKFSKVIANNIYNNINKL